MTSPGFRPTHVVPPSGLPAWEAPDPARPTVPLDALLPVELLERLGEWGRIRCANGWSAWVDGRYLVAVPQDPPTGDGPLGEAADPRPLLAQAEQALNDYRAAVEELAQGALDGESFRARTQGLRIGVVVDGESVWVYDPGEGRWMYGDGRRLNTYASDRVAPRADVPGPDHAPTRVVPSDGEP
ncbi:hypothetical protein [Streptomyces olivochromogenes]|uniref:hypothetical protein n=1 Tax=Streptomyces olivochromogenes TaxID=1963 RepID=UPI001F1A448C|nr:hypothetical protein [Streptomyces olivochromogenes]MCF3137565.1 hypothetical protein [Streptomyces olivochromogenes]